MPRRTRVNALVLATTLLTLVGCSTAQTGPAGSATTGQGVLQVVAAENFWGSIAAQLGGSRVHVTNIIDSPSADPHDYEPTAADGRSIASADMLLANGIGYDPWATQLADANPNPARVDLTVGELLGVAAGSNPHRWYNPADVQQVVKQIVADYKTLAPADATYFDQQDKAFETSGLAQYRAAIQEIRAHYQGTPVGASESIFAMLAPALGLRLVTPSGFLTAVSEGTDPTAADKSTIDGQIADREIKAYVYNSQNATPDVQRQIDEAHAQGIPVTTITETMTPATATWQEWQTAQLHALAAALAQGTGH